MPMFERRYYPDHYDDTVVRLNDGDEDVALAGYAKSRAAGNRLVSKHPMAKM
jgi:hypothetical protein